MTGKTIDIPLTQEQVAIVSVEDADLAALTWCAAFYPGYANGGAYRVQGYIRVDGKQCTQYLHRIIAARMIGRELTRGEQVDHIDCNPLNNQRDNLRLATHAENQRNKRVSRNNASGFKGVGWDKVNRRWRARIRSNGTSITLGYFATPQEAHAAYRAAAEQLHGEFARYE